MTNQLHVSAGSLCTRELTEFAATQMRDAPLCLAPSFLPAGLDADPAVGVDAHRGAQHHRLSAQVVGHLDASVHDGQGDVVRTLHALPAPQHQALSRLRPNAQLKFVDQQSLFTRTTDNRPVRFANSCANSSNGGPFFGGS